MHMQFVICGDATCKYHLLLSAADEIALKLFTKYYTPTIAPVVYYILV